MDRIQIQLPAELRAEIQAIAAAHEWSFAETIRRAGEILVSRYKKPTKIKQWKLPEPMALGLIPKTQEELNAIIAKDEDEYLLRKIYPERFKDA